MSTTVLETCVEADNNLIIKEELVHELVNYYDYNETHGQKNIKIIMLSVYMLTILNPDFNSCVLYSMKSTDIIYLYQQVSDLVHGTP